MTNEINILQFDCILPNLRAAHVEQVLKSLSQHVSCLIGSSEEKIFNHLMAFEKQQTSGIGNGVAMPHMRLPRLTAPMMVFAKLGHLVDFKAMDGEPVDMICLILSPEFEGPKHLMRLSAASRAFNNPAFCDKLRAAEDQDDIRIVLKHTNQHKIAA